MTFVLDLRDQILLLNLKVVLILKYIDLVRAKSVENNQSLYNRFPHNCCHQLPPCSIVSVAVEESYFIFFSGEGE